MADEAPLKLVAKKRKLKTKRDVILRCIIHCCNTKASSPISPITEKSFRKITEACNIRKKQESDFETYGHIIKDIPDEYLSHVHGYHRLCYQKFTNVSKLLKREATTETDSLSHHHLKRRRVSGYSGVLLPSDECLFCGKLRKKRKGKEETLTRCETTSASNLIKEKALTIPDYDIQAKVNDIDLVAREACYHRSCYKLFTQEDERNSTQARGDEDAKDRNISHAAAFEYISDYITESIINNSNVERLGMLKEKYLLFMQQKNPEHYNPNYKTDKLKDKIQRRFGDKVKFWQPNYRTELIYSTHIQSGQAVEVAFQTAASESRRLEESAMFLQRTIIAAYREARELPWPPPPGNELNEWEFPPEHLSNFLSVLLVGKRMDALSADNTRRVLSIGRDIIYAVTKGKWMTPKHILLGMSVWHLTGRADIVSLLNRFGHCVSYSRLLEILTAIHMAIKDHDSPIPPGIKMQDNQVLHFCWDNFDLNEETASGAGTTHSTHGLAIQETVTGQPRDDVSENVLTTAKTKKRSVKEEVLVMEPCFAKKHIEPSLCSTTLEPQQPQSYVSGIKICDMMWVLCRALPKSLKQTVPSLGGWISLTGEGSDNRKTTVEYMPPINAPITDNTTVMHVLKISQEASAAVGQAYTIITFDLAAAKKAYEILWTYPDRFHNVIIRLGAFHMACALIGSIGKYMKGSGLEEVVVQSAVCASGSIDKVMNGKHYNRARYVIRISLEALERMLLASFQDEKGLVIDEEEMKLMSNLAKTPSKENISIVKSNSKWKEWMQKYEEYRAKVRSGEKGKTAQFWIGYMDKAWLLMRFLRATKENDLTLHIACLHEMCPLFFSQEKPNYARYTSVYLNILLNLPHTHPGAMELIEKNGMSVNRSDVPNSRNAVDITIEQTYNRHASGHGPGIIGFSRNLAAYHRWSCTRHARAGYLQVNKRPNVQSSLTTNPVQL